MEEWKEYKLIDVLDALIDYRGKTPKKIDRGIPLITAKIVKGGRINEPNEFLAEEDYDKWMVRGFPKAGDVVLTTEAPLGEVAQLDDRKIALAQRIVTLRGKKNVLDNTYLKYYFLSNVGQSRLKARETGTTVTGIKQSELREVLVTCPPFAIQQKIANILSSLDDKIEVNRRINEQLEELAGALFKSWFVDFEPFKDGEFVDSELGMIPKGWKVGTFSNVVDSTLGGDWGKENEQGNYTKEVFCIRGADIPEIKIGNRGKMPIRYILEKNFAKKSLANNDLVVEISGGSPTQSTGRVCRVTSELLEKYNNSLICTNFCRAIKPFADYSAYIYYYWQYLYDQGTMFNYENGTTGIKNLMINDILDKEPIVIPPINIVEQYKDVVETFATKIQKNGEEIEKLATLRDTLLPKLMSGEIDVNEVEI